jgi:hypothetical protein
MTIITNPFKPDIERYQAYVKPDFVFENFTQYICLNEPARRSHGHRNRLNKAKKHNFRVTVEDGLRALRSWYEIHKRRHQEIGASPLDYQLFENIVVNLSPRNKARIILVWLGDDIISGGLYVRHKNIVDVFMISMNSDYATLGPSFINTDYSLQWARQLGTTTYNWQSSQNKSCGVYEYKKQWGSKDSSYCFVTKLFCSPSIIEELGPTGIKKDYPWHFVVPFDCFTKGFGKTYFTKT